MYPRKTSFKIFIFIYSFILYSISQVSALKCYTCGSNANDDCFTNSEQPKFELDCTLDVSGQNSEHQLTRSVNSAIRSIISIQSAQQSNNSSFSCLTIRRDAGSEKAVTRTCSPNTVSCNKLLEVVEKVPSYNMTCAQCFSDLCNNETYATYGEAYTPSSGNMNAGHFTVIGCLLAILSIRM